MPKFFQNKFLLKSVQVFLVCCLLLGVSDKAIAVCQDGILEVGENCDDGLFPSPIACGFAGNRTCQADCSGYVDAADCFDVDPCNQDPTVTIVPSFTTGAGGEIREYTVSITNNDSAVAAAGCSTDRDFALVLTGLPNLCPDPTLSWEWDLGTKAEVLNGTAEEWDSVGTIQTGNIKPGFTHSIDFVVISCDAYTPPHSETFTITASEGVNSGTDTGDYIIDSTFEICDNGIDDNGDTNTDCDDPDCLGNSHCCGNGLIEGAEDCETDSDCVAPKICAENCTCQDPPASNECPENYDDCDCNIATGVNGCETDLLTDPNNCGMCGNTCLWGCENGACLEPKGGLIPCGRYADNTDTPWNEEENCRVCHLIILANNIIDYLFKIAGVVAALFLAIGGILYIVSAGNLNLMIKAKTAFSRSLYGFAIVFVAWVIINTVMVLFGFNDPLGDGSWKKFSCEVDMVPPDHSYCGDGIVQTAGNGDGQIEECDFRETKVSYLTNNPGKTAEDWVKTIYSCSHVDCKIRCDKDADGNTILDEDGNPLQDKIGTGCYLDDGCTKGRFVCDIVDQGDPSKDAAVCKNTYNNPEYRIVGFACKEQFDYCCAGAVLPPASEFEIIRGPSGNFKCDDVCKKEGKVCIGVGLRDPVTTSCSSLVHNLGSICQNSGNLTTNDCKAVFTGGSGFCQETLGTPTWSMGRNETACYCQ